MRIQRYSPLILFFCLLSFGGFAQKASEVKVIITDINDTKVIRKDTIVSKDVSIDQVLIKMGYDPVSIALAASTKVGRKISIETIEIMPDTTVEKAIASRGPTAEEIMLYIDGMNKDTTDIPAIEYVEPEIIIFPSASFTRTFGIRGSGFAKYPFIELTVAKAAKEDIVQLELSELKRDQDVLNISNFQLRPDYDMGFFEVQFNHFGARETTFCIYNNEHELIYEELIMVNHFHNHINQLPVSIKGDFYIVLTRKDTYFCRKVEIK